MSDLKNLYHQWILFSSLSIMAFICVYIMIPLHIWISYFIYFYLPCFTTQKYLILSSIIVLFHRHSPDSLYQVWWPTASVLCCMECIPRRWMTSGLVIARVDTNRITIWSSVTRYCLCTTMTEAEHKTEVKLAKETPNLTSGLWCVYCTDLGLNCLCCNGTALHFPCYGESIVNTLEKTINLTILYRSLIILLYTCHGRDNSVSCHLHQLLAFEGSQTKWNESPTGKASCHR